VRRARGLAALGLLLTGCGYTLVGRGGSVDPSIKRVGVPLFKDASGKAGLDQKITRRVIEELLKRGGFAVVQEEAGVDAVVDGTITSYNAIPVGFSGAGGQVSQASRYAVVVTARVRYAKPGASEPLWESEAFTFRDEYDVGDASTFFDREDQAIDRLAQSFARSLVAAMLEAF
jgi:hypothetical protein